MEDHRILAIYLAIVGLSALLALLIAVLLQLNKKVNRLLQEKEKEASLLSKKIDRQIERKVEHQSSIEMREYTKVLKEVTDLLLLHDILKSNKSLSELFNLTDVESIVKQRMVMELLDTEISFLDFGIQNVRIQNSLKASTDSDRSDHSFVYVKDLLRYTPEDLLKLRNFGKTSLEEIEKFLAKHELSLRKQN